MRPELNKNTDSNEFINYYWLKEELYRFCKDISLPANGSKKELTDRIYIYLKTGDILIPENKKTPKSYNKELKITLNSVIPKGYKNDEKHREFFKSVIGSHFKFNVQFMNWMKDNHGKSYQEAISEWLKIQNYKKSGKKTVISGQFEYNQYTRDFFKANKDYSREDAIKCWKYKKSLSGSNKYEVSDLTILNK